MTPREYEELIVRHLEGQGYLVQITPYTGDGGVDLIAQRDGERVAVQAKMYGGTRRVNRQTIVELQGVKDLLGCSRAIIATDGRLLPDAAAAADALGIEVLLLTTYGDTPQQSRRKSEAACPQPEKPVCESGISFDEIWSQYVMPLEGRTLYLSGGKPNRVVRVDWSGVHRVTSTGRPQFIEIEIFRKAIERVLTYGCVERKWINQEYPGRASSGTTLILAQVPLFEHQQNPSTIRLKGR